MAPFASTKEIMMMNILGNQNKCVSRHIPNGYIDAKLPNNFNI